MQDELLIRLGFFIGLFALLALLERLALCRTRVQPVSSLWVTNGAILILDAGALRLLAVLLPLLAMGAALDAGRLGWGVVNQTDWPIWVEGLLAVLILVFARWLQHLITHLVPLLWRFHRVHHADCDMDVTTAIRFHPAEIARSMLLKIGLVHLLGPIALAVLVFEVLLNGTALFNHADLRLPPRFDAALRRILVTPDMHRVQHSTLRHEDDRNFGFALSVWDRLFRTCLGQPAAGHQAMTVGLAWQDDRPARLGWSLMLRFGRK